MSALHSESSSLFAAWRGWFAGFLALAQLQLLSGHEHGPVGTISALATQTRNYKKQVKLSYFEPVNCSLSFNEEVDAFKPEFLTKAETTVISNFVQRSKKLYSFQVSASTNANVTLSIAPRKVRGADGMYNNDTTAFFNFEFYAFPPSVTLRLDGFDAQATRKEKNIGYLVFNSTTQYDEDTPFFNESFVSLTPDIAITDFQQVSDMMYRFRFTIPKNESCCYAEDETTTVLKCVDPTAAPESEAHTIFACDRCIRPSLCMMRTTLPPNSIRHVEFPLSVVLQPVPNLGLMTNTTLPMIYDTLWPQVEMDAPEYANGPFNVTITWSEPLADLTIVQPTFPSGPPVAQDKNLKMIPDPSGRPRSFRLLISPKRTGILTISINGTENSIDLAGNSNDYRRYPEARTGAARTVIFSSGPPLPGYLSFKHQRPRLVGEFPEVQGASGFQASIPHELTVSWDGFVTATRYDAWVRWGKNLKSSVVTGLNGTSCTFDLCDKQAQRNCPAKLGVEYQVYVRAYNNWGESIVETRTFLHPEFGIIADGKHPILALPTMLSPTETDVQVNILIPSQGFLTLNPLKVISFRSANTSAGDQDACRVNEKGIRRCTDLNFHMEVPASQFTVFRQPIRLQFIFGRKGWKDLYFRPRLRYWETHDELWNDVASTCPQEQVYDRWNELHRIYEISVCHLSLFALFEDFEPPASTTAPPAPPRPASYGGATFFIVLGSFVVGGALACCICYFACSKQSRVNARRPLAYKEMGIKPVHERLPRRRIGNGSDALALPDLQEDSQLLAIAPVPEEDTALAPAQLALPAPEPAAAVPSPQPLPAPTEAPPTETPSGMIGTAPPPTEYFNIAEDDSRPGTRGEADNQQGVVGDPSEPPLVPPAFERPPSRSPEPDENASGRQQFVYGGQVIYEWKQSHDEVHIYIKTPAEVATHNLDIKIEPRHLQVGIQGMAPFMSQEMFSLCETDGSFWVVADGELHIQLQKAHKAQAWAAALNHTPGPTPGPTPTPTLANVDPLLANSGPTQSPRDDAATEAVPEPGGGTSGFGLGDSSKDRVGTPQTEVLPGGLG